MAESESVTIPVGGMHCQHCVSAVTNALSKLPGVREVAVSLPRGEAVVTGLGLDADAMRAAIEELGFDAGEVV